MIRNLLRPGMTFVDVGANVGYYTALAARRVGPSGSVFAFEPSDYAYPRLTRMVEKSGLTCVRPIKCGLADTPGERFLYGAVREGDSGLMTATMVPCEGQPQKLLVPTETLDRMAERLGIQRIDVMKIDVDGLEPLVIEGAANLIANGRISHILMETAEEWFNQMHTSTNELVDNLKSRGFALRRIGKASLYARFSAG